MRLRTALLLVLVMITAFTISAQETDNASRDATREGVRRILETAGKLDDVDALFRPAAKEPYNFVTSMTDLPNVQSLEVVIRVTGKDTIGVRVYPHFNDGYINLDKLKNANGLMKKVLQYNDTNFLFWGADDEGDLFAAYTFTLESGFPEEALVIVLRSIRSTDRFVGELRPFIDGSEGAP